MDDSLKEALTKLINQINDGTAVAAQQIPEVLTQFIQWHTLIYSTGLFFSLSVLMACVFIACQIHKNDVSPETPSAVFVWSGMAFMALVASVLLSFTLVKVVFFSKLYIVQYAADYLTN